MLNFLKSILGGSDASETVEMPVNETRHPNPKIDHLPGNLFKQELKSNPNAVLMDVRSGMEVRAGALPDAVNIDFMSAAFAQKVAALDKSKTYFLYCRSGNRSGQACQVMHRMGFDVRNLMGGIGAFPR